MKDKKGFTLLELLAVILILGIIALISVPSVNNLIKQARKGALDTSVKNIVKEIQTECTLSKLDGKEPETLYLFRQTGVIPSLKISGKLPTSGFMETDSNCNVRVDVNEDDFSLSKTFEDEKLNVKEETKPAPFYSGATDYYEYCKNINFISCEECEEDILAPEFHDDLMQGENACYGLDFQGNNLLGIHIKTIFNSSDIDAYRQLADFLNENNSEAYDVRLEDNKVVMSYNMPCTTNSNKNSCGMADVRKCSFVDGNLICEDQAESGFTVQVDDQSGIEFLDDLKSLLLISDFKLKKYISYK